MSNSKSTNYQTTINSILPCTKSNSNVTSQNKNLKINKMYNYSFPLTIAAQYNTCGCTFSGKLQYKIITNNNNQILVLLNPSTNVVTINVPTNYLSLNSKSSILQNLLICNTSFRRTLSNHLYFTSIVNKVLSGKIQLPVLGKNYKVVNVIGAPNVTINHSSNTITISHHKNATTWQIGVLIRSFYKQVCKSSIIPALSKQLHSNKSNITKINVKNIGNNNTQRLCAIYSKSVTISPALALFPFNTAKNILFSLINAKTQSGLPVGSKNNQQLPSNIANINYLLHNYRASFKKPTYN